MSARAALRSAPLVCALGCAALGLVVGGRSVWMEAKAALAQTLLERAWEASLASAGEGPMRPWPWADVRAAARLSVPALGTSLVVLDDASGEALAFGPGLVAGDPLRSARETIALGGHRDTHLAFLADLAPGTELRLESVDGRARRYVAGAGRVVDVRRETVAVPDGVPGLVLVTCWPFDAPEAGGPLRWVVAARAADRGARDRPRRRSGRGRAAPRARAPKRDRPATPARARRDRGTFMDSA